MRITRSKQPLFSSCQPRTSRYLRFESLEDRRLLAVGGLANVDEIEPLDNRAQPAIDVVARLDDVFKSAVLLAPGIWDIGDDLVTQSTPDSYSDNVAAAATINADLLLTGGGLNLDLDGSAVTVGLWDSGSVRDTHDEFQIAGGGSRVTLADIGAAMEELKGTGVIVGRKKDSRPL